MPGSPFNVTTPFHIHPHKALVQTAAPSDEPVTLTEMRLHLKIDTDVTADNDLITALNKAATLQAEIFTQRAFITQTWDMFLDDFPGAANSLHVNNPRSDLILVPKPPLASVTTITYVDSNGDTQTLVENTDFTVDIKSTPGRILPIIGGFWPTTRSIMNAVKITFIAGYGAQGTVPEDINAAIKVMVAGWYNTREDLLTDRTPKISGISKTLLWGKRILTIK